MLEDKKTLKDQTCYSSRLWKTQQRSIRYWIMGAYLCFTSIKILTSTYKKSITDLWLELGTWKFV